MIKETLEISLIIGIVLLFVLAILLVASVTSIIVKQNNTRIQILSFLIALLTMASLYVLLDEILIKVNFFGETVSPNKTIEEKSDYLEFKLDLLNIKNKIKNIEDKLEHEEDDKTSKNILKMTATAYTDDVESQGKWVGKTATGITPQVGVVAVDPKVIPLGTKLYVEEYNDNKICIAGDTGGAIKGNRIDLFLPNRGDCIRFGRKKVKVRVVE